MKHDAPYKLKTTAADVFLDSLESEITPTTQPHGQLAVGSGFTAEQRREILEGSRIPTYLSWDLMRSAFRLAELSYKSRGRYEDGLKLSSVCQAHAIGAIVVACAAFEAMLNDMVLEADAGWFSDQSNPLATLLRLSMGLPPEKRLAQIAALAQRPVDWGVDPFQSLTLLLSVRKHLLHHEARLVPPAKGDWPSAKLRAVADRLSSPYPFDDEVPLSWADHVLTPAGAAWAVDVIMDVVVRLEEMRDTIRDQLRIET